MIVKKKKSKQHKLKQHYARVKWVCVGVDTSTYGISLGGIALTTDGKIRVATHAVRWERGTDYFERMKSASLAEEHMQELFINLKILVDLDEVFIGIEEPVSIGHIQRQKGGSQTIKQQVEIEGAFFGGLLRWGWNQIWQIQANQWRAHIAPDLGITTHHTKWNPTGKEGKFRAKQWVKEFHPKWDGDWPDLIQDNKRGLIPRPEGRKAQAVQSDDRYEALAIAQFMRKKGRK